MKRRISVCGGGWARPRPIVIMWACMQARPKLLQGGSPQPTTKSIADTGQPESTDAHHQRRRRAVPTDQSATTVDTRHETPPRRRGGRRAGSIQSPAATSSGAPGALGEASCCLRRRRRRRSALRSPRPPPPRLSFFVDVVMVSLFGLVPRAFRIDSRVKISLFRSLRTLPNPQSDPTGRPTDASLRSLSAGPPCLACVRTYI